MHQIYHTQDLGPPAFDTWPLAKKAYIEHWEKLKNHSLFDYTWRQLGNGIRMAIELTLFYYIGKTIGSGVKRASS